MNAVQEIEIPTHCPLCHKPLGKDVNQVILEDETAICIHCWHLDQELTIRSMKVLPDWWQLLQTWGKWLRNWRYQLKASTREEQRLLRETIEEINSGEVPVVVIEAVDTASEPEKVPG